MACTIARSQSCICSGIYRDGQLVMSSPNGRYDVLEVLKAVLGKPVHLPEILVALGVGVEMKDIPEAWDADQCRVFPKTLDELG